MKTNATATIEIPTHPGSKVWYTWDFDDGNTTVDRNRTMHHIFTKAGVYFVNITAANNISSDTANVRTFLTDKHYVSLFSLFIKLFRFSRHLFFFGKSTQTIIVVITIQYGKISIHFTLT